MLWGEPQRWCRPSAARVWEVSHVLCGRGKNHGTENARACACVCVCTHVHTHPSESACPCPIRLILPTNMLCSQSCARPGSPTPQKPGICHPFRNAELGNEKQGSCPRENFFYYYFPLLIRFSVSCSSDTSSLVGNSGLCKAQRRLCPPGPQPAAWSNLTRAPVSCLGLPAPFPAHLCS